MYVLFCYGMYFIISPWRKSTFVRIILLRYVFYHFTLEEVYFCMYYFATVCILSVLCFLVYYCCMLQFDLMELEIKQLPTTALMLENAAFLMQEDYVNAWPLICDPTSRVLDWLYHYKHDKGLVVVRYSVSYGNTRQL